MWGKKWVKIFLNTDRYKATAKVLSLVKKYDIVFITGKGSEQAIADPNGKLTPWDDRRVIKEELKNIG
ncbi:hypothetical protein KKA15_00255 [Patescibacteria group bacterium]|nr:hypothetical protein [Patescibacteria group bacterium]